MIRSLIILAVFVTMLPACSRTDTPLAPQELKPGTACALDGMLLLDYPGPKAQIQYADGSTEFFCDTVEMFNLVLRPEQQRRIRAVYAQDMGKEDWRQPRAGWIDARQAFYVHGSKKRGSMGPTFASFAARQDAEAFVRQHGGKVLSFAEVTPDMADLRGGASHDDRM